MTTIERYAVTLPGTPGTHAPPRVVEVKATGRLEADGRMVYADDSGDFLVHVTDDGVAEPLADEPGPNRTRCLHAVPLP
ncbi:DUF6296 family protein [Kitasatospora sp. MAP5-34]|uniref:DUF6296 family protein n=1 Tax=Kitasatospora sp. MAP5-34 TaxID=3035102 RepID=UPI0024737817|nr:DUF6296 family protein [Kitasatospora sp. MAP5-34]MDH6580478.1 hypothetical protein [Kitasatospora sp. MAP5-34]